MPNIADYISSPESYGIFNKGRWSRKARLADATSLVEQQRALDEAEKDAEMRRAIQQSKEIGQHGADIVTARDERIGLTAEGDVKKMDRDRARASLPSRFKRDELNERIETAKAVAEQISTNNQLGRAAELSGIRLDKEAEEGKAAIEKAKFAGMNPGIAYELDAAKQYSQENLARELNRTRNATVIEEAKIRTGADGGSLLGEDPFQGTKPGRLSLDKLKAAAENLRRGPEPEAIQADDPDLGLLQKFLKEKFNYQLPQVAR